MISGSNDSINWEALNRLVDPNYNQGDKTVDTRAGRAIEVDANYSENSMAELNNAQKNNKDKLLERYEANQLDPFFCNECDSQICQFIMDGYAKNPAIHEGKALPLEYDARLNTSKSVREAYFQNIWHNAYRYFVLTANKLPNLWMDPHAQYMGSLHYNGQHYKTPQIEEEFRQLIRAMWVSLNDPEFTLSDMYTPDTAKVELINLFGAMGRAHNWDNSRWVNKQEKGPDNIVRTKRVEEEYDDLQLDKPTCPWGIGQRLTQFVMLVLKEDANERILNPNLVRNKFKEDMVSLIEGKNTLFGEIATMDLPTLHKLKEALDDFVVIYTGDFDSLDKEQQALLKQIRCYSTKDVENFINSCKMFYGSFRFTQIMNRKVRYQHLEFQNYGQLALAFARDPWGLFYDAISENINKRIAELGGVKQDNLQEQKSNQHDAILDQDIELLRQQLIELSLRNQQNNLFNQLIDADEHAIKQIAMQYKAQLPQPVAAQSNKPDLQIDASSVEAARVEAARLEAVRLEAARLEAARVEAARVEAARVEAARVEAARVEAARVASVRIIEEERLRELVLQYAFDQQDEELAERMLDAPIAEVQLALEQIAEQRLQADLQVAQLLLQEEEAAARQAAELQRQQQEVAARQAAELQRQQQEAAARQAAELQRQQQEAAARQAAELQRQQQEAAARQAAELQRQQQEAAARQAAELQRQQQEAARQAAELQRQQQEAAARQAAELQRQQQEAARQAAAERQRRALTQPSSSSASPVLPAFNAARTGAILAEPGVKAELAVLFTTDTAKLLLAHINQNQAIVTVLNDWHEDFVKRLILTLSTPEKVHQYQIMNSATKNVFMMRFVEKCEQLNRSSNTIKVA